MLCVMRTETLSQENIGEKRTAEKAILLFDLISRALYSDLLLKKENDG